MDYLGGGWTDKARSDPDSSSQATIDTPLAKWDSHPPDGASLPSTVSLEVPVEPPLVTVHLIW